METIGISEQFLKELYNASLLWVNKKEPQMMLQLVHQIQHDFLSEGYNRAMEVLQDNFKEII